MIAQGLGRVALAERLSIPQLEEALENRTIPAYIGVPLLEEKIQMEERMKMAQAGMRPPPQMTIEDEILQRANQVQAPQQEPQGIDQLPIPIPEYAGGGIVAFDDGGEVSRFQNQGMVLPIQARLRLREMMNPQEQAMFDQTGTIPERLRENIPGVMPPPQDPRAGTPDLRAPVEMRGGRPVPIGPGGEELGIAPPMPEAPQTGTAQPQMGNLLGRTEQLYKGLYGDEKPQAPAEKGDYLTRAKEFFTMAGVDLNLASKQAEDVARQKAELEGDRREAKKYSVISAGLAILAGDSANAFENIGKGAQKGLEQYTTAIKDIQKTEREMDALERSLALAQNQARMGLATVAAGDYQAAQNRYDDLNKEMRNNKANLAKALMSDDRARQVVEAQMRSKPSTFSEQLEALMSGGMSKAEATKLILGATRTGVLTPSLIEKEWGDMKQVDRLRLRNQGINTVEDYVRYRLGGGNVSGGVAGAGQQRVIDFGSIR